ncbi:hypothetical protein [Actinacidiphila yeochonensis]|uniref:hypothetical protein n=1 Tax=Actinacidiphila yeochonensis TaxID=89050 RepID=UPI003898D981
MPHAGHSSPISSGPLPYAGGPPSNPGGEGEAGGAEAGEAEDDDAADAGRDP